MIQLQPLGDQALLASFGNEQDALCWSAFVRKAQPAWLIDVVQAYHSVAVFLIWNKSRFPLSSPLCSNSPHPTSPMLPPPPVCMKSPAAMIFRSIYRVSPRQRGWRRNRSFACIWARYTLFTPSVSVRGFPTWVICRSHCAASHGWRRHACV